MEIDEKQEEQVNDMLADFFPAAPATETITEEETTDQPEDQPTEEPDDGQKGEETEIVAAKETAEETPPVKDLKGEEGTGEKEPSEIDQIRKQNEMLLQRIEELSGKIMSPAPQAEVKEAENLTKEDMLDIIGDEDIDDILASKELFNAAIGKAVRIAEERAMQKVLLSIPQIVMKQTQQQMAIQKATEEFYVENADLVPVKKTVAAVANEIYSTNPQLTIAEIFEKSAEKTREILGLRKQANRLINEQGRTPELVQKTQGKRDRAKAPSMDKLQQELEDLLNF